MTIKDVIRAEWVCHNTTICPNSFYKHKSTENTTNDETNDETIHTDAKDNTNEEQETTNDKSTENTTNDKTNDETIHTNAKDNTNEEQETTNDETIHTNKEQETINNSNSNATRLKNTTFKNTTQMKPNSKVNAKTNANRPPASNDTPTNYNEHNTITVVTCDGSGTPMTSKSQNTTLLRVSFILTLRESKKTSNVVISGNGRVVT